MPTPPNSKQQRAQRLEPNKTGANGGFHLGPLDRPYSSLCEKALYRGRTAINRPRVSGEYIAVQKSNCGPRSLDDPLTV
jgi:hypothetical protein